MINSTLYQNPYSNTIDLNIIYESPIMCQILETEQWTKQTPFLLLST